MGSGSTAPRAKMVLATLGIAALTAVQPAPVPLGQGGVAHAQDGPQSLADLSDRLIDSVVNISTSQRVSGGERNVPRPRLPEGSPFQEFFDEFFDSLPDGEGRGRGERSVQSLGSGFVIDAEEGIIVTNNHVIADADEVVANFNDGSSITAEIIGTDPKTDLAVLKIDPSENPDMQAVPLGDSEAMRVGDWVLAIGNPFGLGGSVSVGIVSAFGRDINSGPYDNFIQTDAAINRGNSGGPLFNMNGEVIGINTAIISPSGGSIGIGFAIPTDLAIGVIEQLREFGETRRGWLGVRIQQVTDDIAESLGMDQTMGALVAGVIEGGPVDDGSIEPGDVIITFDGKPVETMRELPRIVAESPVGKEVDVVVLRDGEEQTVQVTLGRLEDGEQLALTAEPAGEDGGEAVETVELFGMTLAELGDAQREQFGISDEVSGGVVVTAVEEGSAAANRGVAAGDVIVEIAQESVSTPADVEEAITALQESDRRNALLMLAGTDGALRFVTIRID
ncbi:Do family serine endopeptidase [Oceaniradius stylonematis]|uniref:Do family serine endopeptidase n=1 Tax=Oceaniradius stylonematis TaxID=2184161 RepID=UPI0035CF9B5B